MIQINSYINVIDNSGIKMVKCLGINNKLTKLKIGNSFLGCIKKLKKKYKTTKLKKGDFVFCLLIQNKIYTKTFLNFTYKFFNNYCIILNEQKLPIGTRIFCSIFVEPFRIKKLYRILSLAKKVIL